jgi:hypothetical protein
MTSENISLVLQLLAIAAGIVALYKAFQEIFLARKPRLREEFAFAKSFIAELKDDTHPFLVEKGFFAISGDALLSAAEIRYILSLSSPSTALRRYLHAREHLVFSLTPQDGKKIIDFKPNLQSERIRRLQKRIYLASYAVTAFLAFAPLFFAHTIFGNNWQVGLITIVIMLISFGWLAYLSLRMSCKTSWSV